ncbi:MAG: aldehyde dehydrogenase EutE [Actinomycetia bacterium]|nr:aldehyde dehydrogenase EutE [Actinomycetes bacterium]
MPADGCCTADGIGPDDGVYPTVDEAVEAAHRAWTAYLPRSMRERAAVVAAIRATATDPANLEYMAEQAVIQTGMGNVPDKILKNKAAALGTPGTEDLTTDAWSGDGGLTTVEVSPYGVIGAIAPTTNPTETIINNAIGMLAAGNAVVFSPHPRAAALSRWLVAVLNRAIAATGAPEHLLTMAAEPSIENTQALMRHPLVRLLVATGGPGIVSMVLSSGKKAIGAGAGNPPVVVDQTADVKKAAKDIVDGASFDNNLPCTSEKEVIAVDAIADLLRFYMTTFGAFEVRDAALLKAIEALVMDGDDPRAEWIGKSATAILAGVGVEAPAGTRVITAVTEFEHPFVQTEMLMPVLPIVRAKDVDEAIQLAIKAEHGFRHTAVMHSTNVDALTKMAKLIQTTVFVKNGPSYAGIGIGGEGYTAFTIAGPTGEGLTSARTYARRRRCVLVGGLNVR